jgi:hypothetical protein
VDEYQRVCRFGLLISLTKLSASKKQVVNIVSFTNDYYKAAVVLENTGLDSFLNECCVDVVVQDLCNCTFCSLLLLSEHGCS